MVGELGENRITDELIDALECQEAGGDVAAQPL
jgi:hypothetical protein